MEKIIKEDNYIGLESYISSLPEVNHISSQWSLDDRIKENLMFSCCDSSAVNCVLVLLEAGVDKGDLNTKYT